MEASQIESDIKKSTKKPLRKRTMEPHSKEDTMMEAAWSVLTTKKNKVLDADEIFGQNIALSLKSITDKRCKEFAKVKMQEIIFQAQFGIIQTPFQQSNHIQNATTMYQVNQNSPLTSPSPSPSPYQMVRDKYHQYNQNCQKNFAPINQILSPESPNYDIMQ